ncbi:MAG: FMN-binding protein [Candidatus Delongbacteria bacterium]|nr:FMN-binding protein [Candidatus Delongbacteria bacterium]MBN2835013.1 FMN-binding protein [Candidatus Delongbacteria bacterium]
MGNIFKMAAILFVVAGLASGILAYYNSLTKPVIAELSKKNEELARTYVMPEATKFEEVVSEGIKYYKSFDGNNNLIGYVFLASGYGFSSNVETMVGVDKNFKITTIKVVKQAETPGLGAESQKIRYGETKPFFEGRFNGKNSLSVVVDKDDKSSADNVESITGSTITTRAVCNSVAEFANLIKKDLAKGGK